MRELEVLSSLAERGLAVWAERLPRCGNELSMRARAHIYADIHRVALADNGAAGSDCGVCSHTAGLAASLELQRVAADERFDTSQNLQQARQWINQSIELNPK